MSALAVKSVACTVRIRSQKVCAHEFERARRIVGHRHAGSCLAVISCIGRRTAVAVPPHHVLSGLFIIKDLRTLHNAAVLCEVPVNLFQLCLISRIVSRLSRIVAVQSFQLLIRLKYGKVYIAVVAIVLIRHFDSVKSQALVCPVVQVF